VQESVELATILLSDLVGSSRLASSVGPVRADELREEHFALLRQAIASNGGAEIKNLGDGLMVAFTSASGAVKCAVAMQQLFERRYGQAEQGLHIRIGLGAGESTVKDGDYFGMPAVKAARLCAKAPADGILISALVKTLAGRCEGVEFESVGALELKGIPEPMRPYRCRERRLTRRLRWLAAGPCPLCCARCRRPPTWNVCPSGGCSGRRSCSPAMGRASWCCFVASRGSGCDPVLT
jgi:class 3 adenylate cyclase